jgi:hypothetical protein
MTPKAFNPLTGISLAVGIFLGLATMARGGDAPALSTAAVSVSSITVVWVPSIQEDALAAAEWLRDHPAVRLSVRWPAGFFAEDEKDQQALALFKTMTGPGRLDIVLSLKGEMPLVLLQDSDMARSVGGFKGTLPPKFSWPDDAVGQLAAAKSAHRRSWRQDPAGLAAPGGVVAGPEVAAMGRMGLRWVLLPAGPGTPGVFGGLPLPMVRPEALPPPSERSRFIEQFLRDGAPGPLQVSTLDDLRSVEAAVGAAGWTTLRDALTPAPERYPIWPGLDAEKADLSPWLGSPDKNIAWALLGRTRRAVDIYQNSGRADVRVLDLALREIYNAESGMILSLLGSAPGAAQDLAAKREFLATLAQVHRILQEAVPPDLEQGLWPSGGAVTAGAGNAPRAEADGSPAPALPFFEKDGPVLRWNDPPGDGRGPGTYLPPLGSEAEEGAWDLRSFTVFPQEDGITFQFGMGGSSNKDGAPFGFSLTLADVYIDINHLSGAGSEKLLPGRPGLVGPPDAWEYALSVDGWGAALYQYRASQAPRRVGEYPVKTAPGAGLFSVKVPRTALRGEPREWGYGVMIMGRSRPATGGAGGPDPARPMGVRERSAADSFGGADPRSLAAPPYMDLLMPAGNFQEQTLSVYRKGRGVVIPFSRAE